MDMERGLARRPRTADAAMRAGITFVGGLPVAASAGQPSWSLTNSQSPTMDRHEWAPHARDLLHYNHRRSQLPDISGGLSPVKSGGLGNRPVVDAEIKSSCHTPVYSSGQKAPGAEGNIPARQRSQDERVRIARREQRWDEGLKQAARGAYSGNVVDSKFHFGREDSLRRWDTVGGDAVDDSGCGFVSKTNANTGDIYSYATRKREVRRTAVKITLSSQCLLSQPCCCRLTHTHLSSFARRKR